MEYIELHAASAFSFLAAASQPEALIERAAELGMPALALADRNGLYGVARFHTAATKAGVQAHIGAEISVSTYGSRLTPPSWLPHQHPEEPPRLLLLCASQTGYQNLCQLITRFKMRETTKAEGAATLDDLEEFSSGLICLTGGDEGPLAAALANHGLDQARTLVDRLSSIYGPANLYLELQRHQLRDEECRNQALLSLASSLHLPVVATNGVRYATEKDREIQDVLTTIHNHTSLDRAGRLLSTNNSRHLRRMQCFTDIPEAIANTQLISQRLEFTLNNLGYEFPHYPMPAGQSMDSFLAQRVAEGVIKRYGSPAKRSLLAKARAQVEHELKLIAKLGFAGYFLIVWDLIRYCQRHGILVQGRGSAANSAVCYALEITAVDPVGMELLFERFLSENRGEWPDIDLDLPSGDQREQVIQYVYERYGQLGAAMTANVISYRGRSAAREVGKALGFEEDQLARLSSLVGHWEWRGENDTMAHNFAQAGFDAKHPRIARYLDLCMRMQNLPRHLGQHSGGMVICAGKLNRVVPLERASMPGRTVIQWDKEDCADMRLIKVDLLGLGMMAVLKDCTELVPAHYGVPLDLAQLPSNDPPTYRALQTADTVGMFQVESRAQMAALPRNQPTRFYDIVVQVAIIRPGPIAGNMMNPYMKRRRGIEPITYHHPLLEPVLKRTLGIPLFQEQLIRMAMIVANFTGGEAEELRRAVGMRRSLARMKDLEGKLRRGMSQNRIPPKTQDEIVQSISSFALYGFPESHAASFALIAYASAYLKCNYLAAFTAALLNNQPMGFYAPATVVKDAQRHGLRVLPVDAAHSDWPCTLTPAPESEHRFALRLGLNYARGLARSVAEAMLAARARQPFASIQDLALRVPELRRSDLALLAKIGALNSLGEVAHRRDALWQVEYAGRPVGPLLDTFAEEALDESTPEHDARPEDVCEKSSPQNATRRKKTQSPLRQMTLEERLVADFAGTGVTVGRHPMAFHRERLRGMDIRTAAELATLRNRLMVRVAGAVIARQRPGTAKGFVFLSLEDETGIANAILTPAVYEEFRQIVVREKFLLIMGELQNQEGVVSVKATRVEPLAISAAEVRSHDFH